MQRKAVSGIMLTLMLTGMLTLAFSIQTVRASGTIYIRADGSIDPSTALIRREADLYTFLGDINEPIVVERDNVIVDGAGYKLQGIGAVSSKGVDIPGRSNVVVRNMEISAFEYGIYLNRSQNIRIIENNITNGPLNSRGIFLDSSSNNAILRNIINNNFVGIQGSSNNNIFGNNISDNDYGLILGGCTIAGNNIVRNEHGVQGSENTFVRNNFIDNYEQTDTYSSNVWDYGYPSGGNYWSNFETRYPDVEDVYSGPYQNETGSDGIWDHSYDIGWVDGFSRDNYPFVNPCAPFMYHELVVFTLTTPDYITVGDSLSVNATVTNQGPIDEPDVEFVLLVNGTTVDSTTIPLLKADGSHTLSYSLTPTITGAQAKYNITAYAHPVSGEKWVKNNRQSKFTTVWAVGIEAGDWIKYTYTVTNAPSGTSIPTWMKIEILSVDGTMASIRLTMHMSNGTENSETLTLDVSRTLPYSIGTIDTFFGFGFVIPANSTAGGEYTYIMLLSPKFMLGKQIDGEITGTCAGASRTMVYASFSSIGDRYGGSPLKYYWDKKTGVMVEASATINGMPVTAKATETNMWEAIPAGAEGEVPFWMQWWFYAMVAVLIVALGGAVYFLKKRKPPTPTAPPLSTEST